MLQLALVSSSRDVGETREDHLHLSSSEQQICFYLKNGSTALFKQSLAGKLKFWPRSITSIFLGSSLWVKILHLNCMVGSSNSTVCLAGI